MYLTAPVSSKPCVYYSVRALEEVTRHERDNDGNMRETTSWEQRFVEVRGADFYLSDPATPDANVYIPGNRVPMRKHTEEDSSASSGGMGLMQLFTGDNTPPSLRVREVIVIHLYVSVCDVFCCLIAGYVHAQ